MIGLEYNARSFDIFQIICKQVDRELLSFSFLASGGHNDHYLLETKCKGISEKLVLRVRATDQFQNIYSEYKILKKLDGNFGPRCLFIDTDCKILPRPYLLLEYIDGPLYKHNCENGIPRNLIKLVAKCYHSLHLINGPFESEFTLDGYYSVEKSFSYHFKNRYNSSKHVLPNVIRERIVHAIKQINIVEDELTQLMKGTTVASIVQGDPTVGNLVYWQNKNLLRTNNLLFLDWEFARYDLPEFDLVFFLDTYELSDEECDLLLSEYCYFSKGGDKEKLYGIWLCHLMRIIAWRVERIKLVRNGYLKENGHATNEKTSIKRIERYLRRIKEVFEKYKKT